MSQLLHDLRFALRLMAKNPGFTAICVLLLAVGIGVNTAVFSVVNAVILRPLPFEKPEELIKIAMRDTRPDIPEKARLFGLSFTDFRDIRAQNQVFESMTAYRPDNFVFRGSGGDTVRVRGATVTGEFFSVLGVRPAIGRGFSREDEVAQGELGVVISNRLWRERFGGRADAIEAAVAIDGFPCRVAGVMAPGFTFPLTNEVCDLWITTAHTARMPQETGGPLTEERGYHFLQALGRVKPGVSLFEARANVETISTALAQQYPDTNGSFRTNLKPLLHDLTEEVRPALLILLGAAACVLLISCINVANLLLARATARQREIGIRVALGASRDRIIRQLLTESLLLALIAGGLGLVLTFWATDTMLLLLPKGFPRVNEIRPDTQVLAFTVTASVITGLVPESEFPDVNVRIVTPDYFETMQIPIKAGRDFSMQDDFGRPDVMIVNETFAQKYYPGVNLLGRRVAIGISATEEEWPLREIVGIVGDVRGSDLRDAPRPEAYVPQYQIGFGLMTLVARTDGNPASLLPGLRGAILQVDRGAPIFGAEPLDQLVGESVAQQRLNSLLFSIFAGIAIVLTATGLYGVMGYSVQHRTQELGMRIALGASAWKVLGLIMKHGLKLIGIGLALGLLGAFLVTRLLTSLLFAVEPFDPLTVTAVLGLLTVVAAIACLVPARRATLIDPIAALRHQ